MNIKAHIGLVLALCTLTGVGVGTAVVLGYRGVEQRIQQVGPTSAAIKDVARLDDSIHQWLVTSDLVLSNGETFMVSAANRQVEGIRRLIADISTTELADGKAHELASLESQIDAIQSLVEQADDLRGSDRAERLNMLADGAKVRADALVKWNADFGRSMRLRAHNRAQELLASKRFHGLLSWTAVALHLAVMSICWLWTTHKLLLPITELRRATERAREQGAAFELAEQGPDEVVELTRGIASFVTQLQTAKQRTEQEVRDRTEQLVKANQAKAKFLATMSHELRTPLNGIINMNALMLETALDPEQISYARTAKNAAETLLALINDILDFSKIEARKLRLERIPFDPRELVDGAVDVLAGIAESKGLELQAIVAHDVPPRVVGDPTRLRQVLVNLLNNALKFTDRGSVAVRVTTQDTADQQIVLRVEVVDTGIGIPPDRVGSLFQAFEQVDTSTTRRFGGTGLGLAICKELVALMNGTITVTSEVGAGSRFWFTATFGVDLEAHRLPENPIPEGALLLLGSRRLMHGRLHALARTLGVPGSAIHDAADIAQLRRIPGAREHLVLIDPHGIDAASWTDLLNAVQQRLTGVPSRIALLEHWLRGLPSHLGAPPADVPRLPDPCRLAPLQAWIASQPPATTTRAEHATRAPTPTRSRRILVVEDNLVNQKVIKAVIERAGYPCTLAENGQLGVAEFEQGAFDLVLMDCQMPVLDGYAATEAIRRLEATRASTARNSRVPIVALTANAAEDQRQRCLDAGMDAFVTKPFRHHELLELVERLLSEKTTDPAPTGPVPAQSHAQDRR